MKMIKSPLRYPGGKSRISKYICDRFPPFTELREPFVGGGSVSIMASQLFQDKKFWINDAFTPLYKFWYHVIKHNTNLVEKIYWVKDTDVKRSIMINDSRDMGRALFEYVKKNMIDACDIDIAVYFFILNRITFSGTSESGGFSQQAFEKRFTNSSIERVRMLSSIIKKFKVTNFDYSYLLDESGDDVLIYLDPPYYSNTSSALYGKRGDLHTQFDHIRLFNTLTKCNHKWIMSYDNSEYIKNLYSEYNIIDVEMNYGMRTKNKTTTEILISNYTI